MTATAPRPSPTDTEFRNRISPEALAAPILIVDDEPLNLTLIAAYLRQMGFINLEVATDGPSALARVRTHRPDLLILDIMMPGMSGQEVCRTLRTDPEFSDLPILVQTALGSVENRVEIFRTGATDLVVKPINRLELIARVGVHLERRLLIRSMRQASERIDRELQAARAMQMALMPSEVEVAELSRQDLDIAATYVPSSELGGDLWGLVTAEDGQRGVYMVDFSGHGVLSALHTVQLHTLIAGMTGAPRDPADFLLRVNAGLTPLLSAGQFATAICALVDPMRQTLTYAAAGSPAPVLRRDGACALLDSTGVPLGITRSAEYHNRTHAFPQGSALFLYSDALSESTLATGERLGEDGLCELARALPMADANPLLASLTEQFYRRLAAPPGDDLTAIVIRHLGRAAEPLPNNP